MNNNIILLQLNKMRNNTTIFIVLNNIINYKYKNNNLYIELNNKNNLLIKISLNSFEKVLINGIKLNN